MFSVKHGQHMMALLKWPNKSSYTMWQEFLLFIIETNLQNICIFFFSLKDSQLNIVIKGFILTQFQYGCFIHHALGAVL